MVMSDDSYFPRFRSPEMPPVGPESGEGSEFDTLLSGMLDLTSAEGGVSGSEFVIRTFNEMAKQGLELDDYRVGLVAKYGFGSRDEVRALIAGMSEAEFDADYPGDIGRLLIWYTEPSQD